MSIKQRLAKIEAHQTVKEYKGALSFTWESPADDAALEAITHQAEAEGRLLVVSQFVDPPHRGEEI